MQIEQAWWTCDADAMLVRLDSGEGGLSGTEAERRRTGRGATGPRFPALKLLASQFASPLVLILVIGALLSLVLREWADAAIILAIVAGSGILGFTQEYSASQAIAELRSLLVRKVRVRRDGRDLEIPAEEVVSGDLVQLRAGDLVPGDGLILSSDALQVDEAVLTGEPYPVEKARGVSSEEAPVSQRLGALFEGSSIRSGTARMLVVRSGADTLFGGITGDLEKAEQQTEFARGLARFGGMLMRVMLVVVTMVLAASLLLGRELVSSLLFAMALAVAISPELLPAIVSVTLATGARRLAAHGVLVRRLQAIENLGGMDVLCTDKTGTLTKGAIALSASVAPDGSASAEVLRLAAINAALQTGMDSALDVAVLSAASAASMDLSGIEKLGEVPYDFSRRRYTASAKVPGQENVTVTKGAVNEVLAGCAAVRSGGTAALLDEAARARVQAFVQAKGSDGFRVLAVSSGQEGEAVLEGLLLFFDPPKPGIERTLHAMARRGISVRIVSGDNRHVGAFMAGMIGLPEGEVMTGADIAGLDDEALAARVAGTSVFAEVEPQQKERIIRAFQRAGHAVGYMGDGINDAPALRAADVGISVDSAVDVARESADIVLLRPDLDAIRRGVEDGRRTSANTLKYVAITISANFGNMISMAFATVFLPFLPLLPVQILLNNFLSDLPAIAIAGDSVDPERLAMAQRWDIARIRAFMIVFGLISTVFVLATFAILKLGVGAGESEFRTGWFVVSLLTELAALIVLRSRRRFWRSRPAPLLVWSSVFVALVALVLPYSGPIARLLGFVPLSPGLLAILLGLVAIYAAGTEIAKRRHPIQAG